MPQEIPNPDDLTVFAFVPGRYYAAMWSVSIAMGGRSGDVTSLLWRYDNEPEKWMLQYRFRFYRSERVWNSGDRKRWEHASMFGPENVVTAKAAEGWALLAKEAGGKMQTLTIKGDNIAFFDAVKRDKPDWLHIGLPDEVASKGGEAKGN
jgi:hypothetical protein